MESHSIVPTVVMIVISLGCIAGWFTSPGVSVKSLIMLIRSPFDVPMTVYEWLAQQQKRFVPIFDVLFGVVGLFLFGMFVVEALSLGIGVGVMRLALLFFLAAGFRGAWYRTGMPTGENVLRGTVVTDTNAARAMAAQQMHAISPDLVEKIISIGGMPIDPTKETTHFAISGATGQGKTLAIKGILRTVRTRGQKAIISDPSGDYLKVFGRPGDKVLNLFDRRTVQWSPFAEIRDAYDCDRIAAAVIPEGSGNAQFFNTNARNVLSTVMRRMWEDGERSTHKLTYLCTGGDRKKLEPYVSGTTVESLLLGEAGGAADSVRGTLGQYMQPWGYLPDTGDFSIREWVRGVDRNDDSWLFLPFNSDQKALLGGLICTALSMAFVEGLSLPPNDQRRLWYILDEVGTLGTIPNLTDTLDLVRKHGGAVTLGFQTVAQLRQHYGDNFAESLMANTGTVLLLNPNDPNTAEWAAKRIGQVQIRRTTHGTSSTAHPVLPMRTNTQSANEQVTIEDAVLPAQLMNLPQREGYLRRSILLENSASILDWSYVQVPIVALPDTAASFERTDEPIQYMASVSSRQAPSQEPVAPATDTPDDNEIAAAESILASWKQEA